MKLQNLVRSTGILLLPTLTTYLRSFRSEQTTTVSEMRVFVSSMNCITGLGGRYGIPNSASRWQTLSMTIFLLVLSSLSIGAAADETLTFSSLEKCTDSSFELSKYGAEDELSPCVLYDEQDFPGDNNATSEITLVQVTPSFCHNHRDGAVTAVKLLNSRNDGLGTPIGYLQDHYVKFRLVSIVAGNIYNDGETYKDAHITLLDSVLAEIENAHYIIGSCSQHSVNDKPVALKRQKIVISQVGPPGFYMDVKNNPYVFGIHVNSDTYPLPALQALKFHLQATGKSTSQQPVSVIYRDKSEFFYSTCRSVIDEAIEGGFDVTEIEFDPFGDEDGSGVQNIQNVGFMENLTDILCPANNGNSTDDLDDELPPAIFACVGNEADTILARMRHNGCRPSLSWFTTATWGWAGNNLDAIPYFQGGGQWHKNFKYSDDFFESGQDILDYGLKEFGYSGSYDHVVSYAIPNLIAELVQSFFRIDDVPDVDFTYLERYDDLRKAFIYINANTIFGPVSFNEFQRNNGRGAAGAQWIPVSYAVGNSDDTEEDSEEFVMGCMSPLDQADAAIIVPSPSGSLCEAGNHVNQLLIETEPSILQSKCSACPLDTYQPEENKEWECLACPTGSTTKGETGATYCLEDDPNLIPQGLKVLGYIFVVSSWSLAIAYMVWMFIHKEDSVVKIGQPEFLLILCIGAMISSSSIIPLSLAEADVGEDTAAASRSCQALPWLYSLGWVLMYSSLTAKSYRLTMVAKAASRMNRIKITALQMSKIIIVFVVLDAIILIAWQAIDPLVYERTVLAKVVDDETGIVTIESVGQCSSDSLWKFLGPIIAIHVCLMVVTNILLWNVRNMSDRYQEQKFVALASLYTCELLLLGVPILIAVQDSSAARYMVMAGVIFLTDTGVLSLVFVPKIKFQKDGLPMGVSVAQSLNVNRSSAGDPLSRYGLSSKAENGRDFSNRDSSYRSRPFGSSTEIIRDRDTSGRGGSVESFQDSNGQKRGSSGDLSLKQGIEEEVVFDSGVSENKNAVDSSRELSTSELVASGSTEMNGEN